MKSKANLEKVRALKFIFLIALYSLNKSNFFYFLIALKIVEERKFSILRNNNYNVRVKEKPDHLIRLFLISGFQYRNSHLKFLFLSDF